MVKMACAKNKLMTKKRGSQTLDWIVIAVIVVLVAIVLWAVLQDAVPDLFQSVIDRIEELLGDV